MSDTNAVKVLSIALKDPSCREQLLSQFESRFFLKDYRIFADIFYELTKQRIVLSDDVLRDYLKNNNMNSEQAIAAEKVYQECQSTTFDVGEFNFYFTELKKQRADRILRNTLSGMDENGNPIVLKGKQIPSIPDLLNKSKDPYEASKLLKQAVIEIDQLVQKDPIIRVNMRDRWESKLKEYEEKKVNKAKAVGILTGFGPFDDMTRGIGPGEMFLFCGKPGAGKSQCLHNIARRMFRDGKNLLLFSLEMPHDQYEDRFISCFSKINTRRMQLGALTPDEERLYRESWKKVGTAPNQLEIVDFPNVNSFRIEIELGRALDKFVPDCVIVDYLGIMKPNDKASVADWEAQGRIAEELRQVARIYKVPVISAVQLNRSKDKSADTDRLSRSDIIAQTADAIVMINDKSKDDNELSDQMKLTVIKNRKGESSFEFGMYKNFETATIENLPSYKSTLEALLETM